MPIDSADAEWFLTNAAEGVCRVFTAVPGGEGKSYCQQVQSCRQGEGCFGFQRGDNRYVISPQMVHCVLGQPTTTTS